MTTPVSSTLSACPVCPMGTASQEHARGPDFEYGTTGDAEWSFRRCEGCGTVFLSPRPSDSELGRIYPGSYYAYDFTAKRTLGYRVKTILDRASAREYLRYAPGDGNILDIGCGDGRLLSVFADLGVDRSRLHGMELDARAVETARARGLQVQQARFEDASCDRGTFDLVLMQQVIEHVPDPRAVIRRIRELLRPGGAAVFETPNVASWDHALFRRRHWGGYHIPRHFYLFSPASFARLLAENGFAAEKTKFLLSPSFWVQSVHHLCADKGYPSLLRKFFHPHLPNPMVLSLFSAVDLVGTAFGWTSNMRVVGRAVS